MSLVDKRSVCLRVTHTHRRLTSSCESLMDEADREVSSLTDRAFRSLCVGDEAVYNDGEPSPCLLKPLAADERTSKKKLPAVPPRRNRSNGSNGATTSAWQHRDVSSLLTAFTTGKKNGDSAQVPPNSMLGGSGVESWDASALRSIQRELAEFSTDLQHEIGDGSFTHGRKHAKAPADNKSSSKRLAKDSGKPSGKSKHGKSSNSKLRKLNSRNFFLHSEFSPFQAWKDLNQFPFGQESISDLLPSDTFPRWCDSSLYRHLSAAHTLAHNPETQTLTPTLDIHTIAHTPDTHTLSQNTSTHTPALAQTSEPSHKGQRLEKSQTTDATSRSQCTQRRNSTSCRPEKAQTTEPAEPESKQTLKNTPAESKQTLDCTPAESKQTLDNAPGVGSKDLEAVQRTDAALRDGSREGTGAVLRGGSRQTAEGSQGAERLQQAGGRSETLSKPVQNVSAPQQHGRASSDNIDFSAPWRRNRSRAMSAAPSSSQLEKGSPAVAADRPPTSTGAPAPRRQEVRRMEGQNSAHTTPFNITHLLTPVIPCRQETESLDPSTLPSLFSPSTLDLSTATPVTLEPKASPETKARESYRSIASSLLFNLKDNRKRVKAMYSPPRFRPSRPDGTVSASGMGTPVHLVALGTPIHLTASDTPVVLLTDSSSLVDATSALVLPGNHLHGSSPADPRARSAIPGGSMGEAAATHTHPSEEKQQQERDQLLVPEGLHLGSSPLSRSPLAGRSPGYACLNMYKRASPQGDDLSPQPPPPEVTMETQDKRVNMETQDRRIVGEGQSEQPVRMGKDDKPKKSVRERVKELQGQNSDTQGVTSKNPAAKWSKETPSVCATNLPSADGAVYKETSGGEGKEKARSPPAVPPKPFTVQKPENPKPGKQPPPVPKRTRYPPKTGTASPGPKQSMPTDTDPYEDPLLSCEDPLLSSDDPLLSFSARQNSFIKSQRSLQMEDEDGEEWDEQREVALLREMKAELEARQSRQQQASGTGATHPGDNPECDHTRATGSPQKTRTSPKPPPPLPPQHDIAEPGETSGSKNKAVVSSQEHEALTDLAPPSPDRRVARKGVLSLRGNTLAKRDIFATMEQTPSHTHTPAPGSRGGRKGHTGFTRYDLATMALEEVIADREERKRRRSLAEVQGNTTDNGGRHQHQQQQQQQWAETAMQGHNLQGRRELPPTPPPKQHVDSKRGRRCSIDNNTHTDRAGHNYTHTEATGKTKAAKPQKQGKGPAPERVTIEMQDSSEQKDTGGDRMEKGSMECTLKSRTPPPVPTRKSKPVGRGEGVVREEERLGVEEVRAELEREGEGAVHLHRKREQRGDERETAERREQRGEQRVKAERREESGDKREKAERREQRGNEVGKAERREQRGEQRVKAERREQREDERERAERREQRGDERGKAERREQRGDEREKAERREQRDEREGAERREQRRDDDIKGQREARERQQQAHTEGGDGRKQAEVIKEVNKEYDVLLRKDCKHKRRAEGNKEADGRAEPDSNQVTKEANTSQKETHKADNQQKIKTAADIQPEPCTKQSIKSEQSSKHSAKSEQSTKQSVQSKAASKQSESAHKPTRNTEETPNSPQGQEAGGVLPRSEGEEVKRRDAEAAGPVTPKVKPSKSYMRDFLSLLGLTSDDRDTDDHTSTQSPQSPDRDTGAGIYYPQSPSIPSAALDITVHDILKCPVYSPQQSPMYSPLQSPVYSPLNSPVYSPLQSPLYSPLQSPLYSPLQSPIRSPSSHSDDSQRRPGQECRLWGGVAARAAAAGVGGGGAEALERSDRKEGADESTFSNPGSDPDISESGTTSPLDNGGWVRSLIEQAKTLSPNTITTSPKDLSPISLTPSQSNASSPTPGASARPVLFKVKDNTFATSPVTKTVRPVLHRSVQDLLAKPWSPREGPEGSDRGSDRADETPEPPREEVELHREEAELPREQAEPYRPGTTREKAEPPKELSEPQRQQLSEPSIGVPAIPMVVEIASSPVLERSLPTPPESAVVPVLPSPHQIPPSPSQMPPSPGQIPSSRVGQLLEVPAVERGASVSSSLSEGPVSSGGLSEGQDEASVGEGSEVATGLLGGAHADDAEDSKAASEHSGSVCSGTDAVGQGRKPPPAVLPKTEKGVKRALKLTTRRIQKEEKKIRAVRHHKSTEEKPEGRHRHHRTPEEKPEGRLRKTEEKPEGRDCHHHSTEEEKTRADHRHRTPKENPEGHHHTEDISDTAQGEHRRDITEPPERNPNQEQPQPPPEQGNHNTSRISKESERKHHSSTKEHKSHHTRERPEQHAHERLDQTQDTSEQSGHHRNSQGGHHGDRQGRGGEKHARVKHEVKSLSSDRHIGGHRDTRYHGNEPDSAKQALEQQQQLVSTRDGPSNGNRGDRRSKSLERELLLSHDRLPHRWDKLHAVSDFTALESSRGSSSGHAAFNGAFGRQNSSERVYPNTAERPAYGGADHCYGTGEHSYTPSASSLVPQSFPMTQRKLLQDPDSGQYFVVDMPVQVTTKTFFDPETGSYVQLPVQSGEGAAVASGPPVEAVMNPSLLLYRSFVPMPVSSSLPQHKASHAGSHAHIDMEPGDNSAPQWSDHSSTNDHAYMEHSSRSERPYLEPVYAPKDHTPEEELDSLR